MNFNPYSRLAAVSILGALAIPVRVDAQTNGDPQITILQTTDLHHHANGADHTGLDVDPVNGTGLTGAYTRISAYVNYVRSNTSHPVVLVDSGDWTMGTLYDLTLASRPLGLQFLDLMKYDCVTLGNHEFDYTPKGLAQTFAAAQTTFAFKTPIVASNMNLGGNTDLAPFVGNGKVVQTTRIQDLANGVRVGYIGLMGKGAALNAAASAPVSFTDFSTNYSAIQSLVDNLRNSQGVQVVIALSHSGTDGSGTSGEDVALASHVRGIDVIASGHTHTPLAAAHAVTNGGWTTQIIDAGAYGTNVARIDVTYHAATNSTTLDASSSAAMTDAGLSAIHAGLAADPAIVALVKAADQLLNTTLSAFFTSTFADYDKTNLAKGIYHPVGTAAQNMVYNGHDPTPSPNGLGDLVADSIRSIPNSIVTQTLAAVGNNPANLPGYDFTPFQAGLVATGQLRGTLLSGAPLSFADVYNVLPLGATPDSTQALPVGYPMISGYLELADVKTLCALQLVAQSNLAPVDYYLNFSGLKYGLKTTESYLYFKYATAAGVLQLVSQKAAAGSIPAFRALAALATLGQDSGAALLAAYGNDNPYAGALVKLNDANPTLTQIGVNLGVVGQVAASALADASNGTNTVSALVVSKAVAAIDTVSGFALTDAANTGSTTDLMGASRIRIATDLFAVLALGAVQAQFGVNVRVYKSATGPVTLSGADLSGLLSNRINAAPAGAGVQELKEWMALLSYVQGGLKGVIPSAYASTSDFTQFASAGAAVTTRNTSYPLASIAQFGATLSGLVGVPACAAIGTPAIAAVTDPSYGSKLFATGTIIVWGSGFSSSGGNSIQLTRVGATDSVTVNESTNGYFWNLSANQINATLPSGTAAGQWLLSVRNACGATSANYAVTLQ
jgi:2',3'-cyclic-nucleotide 2'-phosphodiesterase (5'-nucleotidase family)